MLVTESAGGALFDGKWMQVESALFDANWRQVESALVPVPLILIAELIDRLTEAEANLPTDDTRPALSPAQWSARQSAACKVLFTLYWLRQYPGTAKQAGESALFCITCVGTLQVLHSDINCGQV